MTVWRWGASDVPSLSAFFPAVTKTPATWQQYKQHLTGEPGTQAIPAPNNDIPQDRYQISADHRSSDAPAWWYPQLWFEDRLPGLPFPAGANDCGVRVYSDNQIPIPAIDPTRGTYRYGGGEVVPAYQNSYRRAVTQRTVQVRYA
jgi:hypothetical protein